MTKTTNEANRNAALEIIRASEIEPKKIKWLWYPLIPFGKVTLLQGDPGDGKSAFILTIAALLTSGEPLPFTDKALEPMNVIYQTRRTTPRTPLSLALFQQTETVNGCCLLPKRKIRCSSEMRESGTLSLKHRQGS